MDRDVKIALIVVGFITIAVGIVFLLIMCVNLLEDNHRKYVNCKYWIESYPDINANSSCPYIGKRIFSTPCLEEPTITFNVYDKLDASSEESE